MKSIITLLFILTSFNLYSQQDLSKSFYIGTGFTLTNFKSNKSQRADFFNYKLNPIKIGYFISNKVSIGFNYDYNLQNPKPNFNNYLSRLQMNSVNTNFRYFFSKNKIRPYAHIEIGTDFGKTVQAVDVVTPNGPQRIENYESKYRYNNCKGGIGLSFILKNISLESDLVYSKNLGNEISIFDSDFRFRIGANYLIKSK
ncbi:MAG: hypothetical protein ACOVOQ_13080 [Flavobacterium sp.]